MSMSRPPDPTPDDIDARFAEIVAGWDVTAPDEPSGGLTEPAAEDERPEPLPAAPAEPRRPTFQVAPSAWRVHTPPEEEDEEFVAPDPPLPRGDVVFWVGVLGLALGPVVFIAWVLTGPHSTNLPLALAALGTIAGFAALIARMPGQRDEDDDGAVV